MPVVSDIFQRHWLQKIDKAPTTSLTTDFVSLSQFLDPYRCQLRFFFDLMCILKIKVEWRGRVYGDEGTASSSELVRCNLIERTV